jgi:hypothetical protein
MNLLLRLIIILKIERYFYSLIHKVSFIGLMIRPNLLVKRKKVVEKIINKKISISYFLSYSISGFLSYNIGIKLLTKNYLKNNLILNGELRDNTIIISSHLGQSNFLYNIFKYLNYNCTYIRSSSFEKFDFAYNHSLYNDEYIFENKNQIIDITKQIYAKKNVYVSLDGSLATDKLSLNENYYIKYSSLLPKIGLKKDMNIAFINCINLPNGKTILNIDYYDKSIEFDVWYKSKYIETLTNYPYSLNIYKLFEEVK